MADYSSLQVQRCLERLQAGDSQARTDLINGACERLQRLTRALLRHYPGVHRWEETGDVAQNAVLRLCRALEQVTPPTARDFFRLAALQIRRELIDLARHYYGPQGAGGRHASHAPQASAAEAGPPLYEAADLSHEPVRLAAWTEFHERIEALPDEEREVVDLLFYQGLKQEEAAELVGVTVRTIKARWRSARLRLHAALGGELPGS